MLVSLVGPVHMRAVGESRLVCKHLVVTLCVDANPACANINLQA